MVRKSSKLISSASPSDSCRRFLGVQEPRVMGSPGQAHHTPSKALSLRFGWNVPFPTPALREKGPGQPHPICRG